VISRSSCIKEAAKKKNINARIDLTGVNINTTRDTYVSLYFPMAKIGHAMVNATLRDSRPMVEKPSHDAGSRDNWLSNPVKSISR